MLLRLQLHGFLPSVDRPVGQQAAQRARSPTATAAAAAAAAVAAGGAPPGCPAPARQQLLRGLRSFLLRASQRPAGEQQLEELLVAKLALPDRGAVERVLEGRAAHETLPPAHLREVEAGETPCCESLQTWRTCRRAQHVAARLGSAVNARLRTCIAAARPRQAAGAVQRARCSALAASRGASPRLTTPWQLSHCACVDKPLLACCGARLALTLVASCMCQPRLLGCALGSWLDFLEAAGLPKSSIKDLISSAPRLLVRSDLVTAGRAMAHLRALGFEDAAAHRVIRAWPQVLALSTDEIDTLLRLWAKFAVGVDERAGI